MITIQPTQIFEGLLNPGLILSGLFHYVTNQSGSRRILPLKPWESTLSSNFYAKLLTLSIQSRDIFHYLICNPSPAKKNTSR